MVELLKMSETIFVPISELDNFISSMGGDHICGYDEDGSGGRRYFMLREALLRGRIKRDGLQVVVVGNAD